jgi:hypothetical protein
MQNKKNKKSKMCIVCDFIKNSEKRYLSIVKDYLKDDEFKKMLLKSDGLCIPHYKNFINKYKNIPKWFFEFHIKKYEDNLFLLNEYLDNCNYTVNKNKPITTSNKTIWKKIVKILFGYEGKLD